MLIPVGEYQYDLFVSYHRGQRLAAGGKWPLAPDGRWVHEVFFDEFRHRLDMQVSGVRIAFDRDLPLGSPWLDTLKGWVRTSKCMLSIWNPPYFRSDICRSEFHSMLERQKQCPTKWKTPRLIPIVYADQRWFDEEARALQFSKDFSEFNAYVCPIQAEDPRCRFVKALDELCEIVARSIEDAPEYREDFPWCDKQGLPPAHLWDRPSLQ